MPKKIFITGIAGFIGFHLALYLKKRGDFVIGCDNFNPYYDPELKRARQRFLQQEGISLLECDIRNTDPIRTALQQNDITHFVHLAAQAGVRYSMTHPEAYLDSNLDGFVKILEMLKLFPGIPITYASSSSVYGLNQKIPFSENDTTDAPASFYGATKKANELIAHAYHHQYQMPVTGLRFFTVYGPWGRPDMAYFSFTKAILNDETIKIYSEGKMLRDFTYIEDIVQGTASAIDKESRCEIFNLGNNKPESVLTLISHLEEKLGKEAKKEFLPAPAGDVPATYADIEKSQKVLGFQPKTSLKEGISQFVDWYLKDVY